MVSTALSAWDSVLKKTNIFLGLICKGKKGKKKKKKTIIQTNTYIIKTQISAIKIKSCHRETILSECFVCLFVCFLFFPFRAAVLRHMSL